MGLNPSGSSIGDNYPVESITWDMAAGFANEVSILAGLQECYTCSGTGNAISCDVSINHEICTGYRLLTEAEWEGAARCGQDSLYSGGNTIDSIAWYSSNASITKEVATMTANNCGLFDMSGNVWEWTQDWYSSTYYTISSGLNPTGPLTGDLHPTHGTPTKVMRGGSAWDNTTYQRLSKRYAVEHHAEYYKFGFRIARTAQ
jgi:formylglycine-generating enzyme required for sulfatase activity